VSSGGSGVGAASPNFGNNARALSRCIFRRTLTRWFARAGLRAGGVVVLRPDRFVFGVAAPGRGGPLVAELRRQLGISALPGRLTVDQPVTGADGTPQYEETR